MKAEDKIWAQKVSEKIKKKMQYVVKRNTGKIPYSTVNGVYNDYSQNMIGWWTNGFWGGILWQLYNATKEDFYKSEALLLEERLDAVLMNAAFMDHDSGFKWLPTAVAHYRYEPNAASLNRGLLAADNLAGRFNPVGKFIKAWNDNGTGEKAGWAIIDCMMNIPLLYWAYEITKDPKYRHIATLHADTAMKYFVREDGSVKHIVEFDPKTGEYLCSHGGQGYAHGSSWTRGQGWAVYGFVLSYIHTKEQKYLDCAKKVGDYFIAHIPKDYIIPIDFCQPEEPHFEDSIAPAVAACGFIEIARYDQNGERYLNEAIKLLKILDEKRCNWSEACDQLLEYCSEGYYTGKNNISIMYGDYYFIEAVFKLTNEELFIW